MADLITDFDVIIVGGGATGLSAARSISKRDPQQRVLVVERFKLFNEEGSSGEHTRFFRTAYTELELIRLAYDTIPMWKELEDEAGAKLIDWCGLLNFGDKNYTDGPEGNLMAPIANLRLDNHPVEELTLSQVEGALGFRGLARKYPDADQFGAFLAPDNGAVHVPSTLKALHGIAKENGVQFLEDTRCLNIEDTKDGHVVVTVDKPHGDKLQLSAGKVLVTAGAYTNDVIKSLGIQLNLTIWENMTAYYEVDTQLSPIPHLWFQFLKTSDQPEGFDLVYGFPPFDWAVPGHARVAIDHASVQYIDTVPEVRQRKVEADLEAAQKFVRDHVKGASQTPVDVKQCLAVNVADNGYVLDFVPGTDKRVVLYTAGWAFKFVPLFGKFLAELVLDGHVDPKYEEVFATFKIDRTTTPPIVKPSSPPAQLRYESTAKSASATARSLEAGLHGPRRHQMLF
eukprot:TRINITY_DN2296_c0_g1_i2.p1 TRINITY_DN2296_c0_g1~~TRINITY_DN2296_c0_g1_i2.p1  ORF type:complete len:483 (+),score=115.37 TRINITY_DN2296_c0_g1_i2:85-1449(+)